jgi:hypothetical protein
MATYTFTPPLFITPQLLSAPSTHAKISFQPLDVYIAATLEWPTHANGAWTARVENVPIGKDGRNPEEKAVLHLTRGEFGRVLGSVELN